MFDNTLQLTKFIMKRDLVRIIATLLIISFVIAGMALGFANFYSSETQRELMAFMSRETIMIFMAGPGYGLEAGVTTYSMGAIVANNVLWPTSIIVASVNIIWVNRHTRTDEEQGRLELVRSLPVGKSSGLAATFVSVLVKNLLLALMIGLGLTLLGIEEMNLFGSLFFGAALAVTGVVFASIAALCAQLSKNAQTTLTYAFAVLIISYVIRGIGDNVNETLACLSPLGLMFRAQPYVANEWWPFLLLLLMAIVIWGAALYFNQTRDLGSGLLKTKSGKSRGGFLLNSHLGLTFKLARSIIIGFGIVLFMMGLSFGSGFNEESGADVGKLQGFKEYFSRKEVSEEEEEVSVSEHTASILFEMFPLIATIPTITILLNAIKEEKRERIDLILSRAVSRKKFISNHFLMALIMSILGISLSTLGFYISTSNSLAEPFELSKFILGGMVYLPAIWVFIGIVTFLIGLIPITAGLLSWMIWGIDFIVVYFGALLQLPEWLEYVLSPFRYFRFTLVEGVNVLYVIFMILVALTLTFIGIKGYQTRDIK